MLLCLLFTVLRSIIAVKGSLDDIVPSTVATFNNVTSASGVFSSDEVDFTEIKQSSFCLTDNLHSGGVFTDCHSLQLAGEVVNFVIFLKHITSELTSLNLKINLI